MANSNKGRACPEGVKVQEKEPFGYQRPALNDKQLTDKLDRVDELVSLLLDDELEDQDVRELEGLLLESPQARTQYVGMIQLHTDLIEYYNPQSLSATKSPILAHLGDGVDVVPPTSHKSAD